MPVIIGISGWQYRHWRETFYPKGVAQAGWLEFYAERFAAVEINNTFYRLPDESTFDGWARRTPRDFVAAVKMSRYLTHLRRLRDPAEPLGLFMARAGRLGQKLGPVLVQLPPDFKADPAALSGVLAEFPAGTRVAVELRHESWFDDEVRSVLADHGAALCLADSPRRRTPVWRTAAWTFLRLHEGRASPHPCYGRRALSTWASRLAGEWGPEADAYVFFNNDGRACAIRDAIAFAEQAERQGLRPTRVPRSDEVRLG